MPRHLATVYSVFRSITSRRTYHNYRPAGDSRHSRRVLSVTNKVWRLNKHGVFNVSSVCPSASAQTFTVFSSPTTTMSVLRPTQLQCYSSRIESLRGISVPYLFSSPFDRKIHAQRADCVIMYVSTSISQRYSFKFVF